jgi:hypothetical protein
MRSSATCTSTYRAELLDGRASHVQVGRIEVTDEDGHVERWLDFTDTPSGRRPEGAGS